MKTITIDETKVEYSLECLPEDCEIEGNAMASGDDGYDKEVEQKIIDQLNSGNEWAWCTVKVTAHIGRFHGSDYLGCCSYESEEQFTQDGYYDDMKHEALEALKLDIMETNEALEEIMINGGD